MLVIYRHGDDLITFLQEEQKQSAELGAAGADLYFTH